MQTSGPYLPVLVFLLIVCVIASQALDFYFPMPNCKEKRCKRECGISGGKGKCSGMNECRCSYNHGRKKDLGVDDDETITQTSSELQDSSSSSDTSGEVSKESLPYSGTEMVIVELTTVPDSSEIDIQS